MNHLSRHHILHGKSEWMATPEARDLRTTFNLIPRMDRELHDRLHAACPPVPLLSRLVLNRTLNAFTPATSAVLSTDRLISAIETTTKQGHQLERDLGFLAMEALELQRPFLRENEQTATVIPLYREERL